MKKVIEIQNIKRNFQVGDETVHALRGVSFNINEGEFVTIMGTSGSGKSTLLNILGCLDTPTSGTYLLEGLNVAELTDDELAEVRALRIGFVFQSFNLLPRMSVLDNVTLPLAYTDVPRREREVRAVHALRSVGLPVDHYDHRTNELSGGQMQRVAIARALVNDPAIILADEPTGNLDSVTGRQVMDTFHALKRAGKTIVLITHEMAVVKEICDRVAVMEYGRVVEQGEVFTVFAEPKQDITKSFIHTTSNLQKVEALIAEDSPVTRLQPGELIVRLSYVQRNVNEPIISAVSQMFNVSLNIIFADITIVQDSPIGGTVAIISGERKQITKAIEYLIEKNVGVEVIKDARADR